MSLLATATTSSSRRRRSVPGLSTATCFHTPRGHRACSAWSPRWSSNPERTKQWRLAMSERSGHEYLTSHQISGNTLVLNLAEESQAVLAEARAANIGHAAKTLIKEGPLRI